MRMTWFSAINLFDIDIDIDASLCCRRISHVAQTTNPGRNEQCLKKHYFHYHCVLLAYFLYVLMFVIVYCVLKGLGLGLEKKSLVTLLI